MQFIILIYYKKIHKSLHNFKTFQIALVLMGIAEVLMEVGKPKKC